MTPLRHPADGRIHFSELKHHSACPAHVRHATLSCRDVTRPMVVGAIADAMVFGNRGWALYPGKIRQGAQWEAFRIAHKGEVICIASEYEDAVGAADAVRSDPVARELLEGCSFQVVAQWDAWDLPCAAGIEGERGGFDAVNAERGYLVDMKVTSSTNPNELDRHILRQFWHAQGAWYLEGINRSPRGTIHVDYNGPVKDFYILAVQASAPHCVTVVQLGDDVLQAGRKLLHLWTERHRACEASGVWPGYTQSVHHMAMPEWYVPEGEDE